MDITIGAKGRNKDHPENFFIILDGIEFSVSAETYILARMINNNKNRGGEQMLVGGIGESEFKQKETKETQVREQLIRIGNGLELLESSICDLDKRLDCITVKSNEVVMESKPEQSLVGLADELRAVANRILDAQGHINNMRNRIQL